MFGRKGKKMTQLLQLAILFSMSLFMVGCADLGKNDTAHQRNDATPTENTPRLLMRSLEAATGMPAVTVNGRAVEKETRGRILTLLAEEVRSFRPCDKDCRASANGPMLELAPSRTISYHLKDGTSLEVSLYTISATHSVLQVQTSTPVTYWRSEDKKLIKMIDSMDTLK
jgi:hypothetical protein